MQHKLFILFHKVIIELLEGLQSLNKSLLRQNQSGNSEMVSIWSLLESTSRYKDDTSLLQS